MKPRTLVICTLLTAIAATQPMAALAGCTAQSGPNTAALVELYTSEGCSSCPPADKQLSRLHQTLDPNAVVVPLSLHVDYWDYIGWKDPFAQKAFTERQRWLAQANRQSVVYTPHFFVGGAELQTWRGNMRDEVRKLNAQPAKAQIRVEANLATSELLTLSAEATAPGSHDPVELFVAVTESGLVSKVVRGENSGVTLSHDHVARVWIGPISLTGGKASLRRDIPLPPSWSRAQLDVVAFVEDARTGRVLQAASAHDCARS